MAAIVHEHHLHVMTRFRVQVLWRALALVVVGALTWALPAREAVLADGPGRGWGSVLTEVNLWAALGLVLVLAGIGFAWQWLRPADMGALAWVVAGGALVLLTAAGVLLAGSGTTMYSWLTLGVVITSTAVQVLAVLTGHAAAVLVRRTPDSTTPDDGGNRPVSW